MRRVIFLFFYHPTESETGGIPDYKWDFCGVNPLISGVMAYVLSGMIQVVSETTFLSDFSDLLGMPVMEFVAVVVFGNQVFPFLREEL